jgi:hypothetical protein
MINLQQLYKKKKKKTKQSYHKLDIGINMFLDLDNSHIQGNYEKETECTQKVFSFTKQNKNSLSCFRQWCFCHSPTHVLHILIQQHDIATGFLQDIKEQMPGLKHKWSKLLFHQHRLTPPVNSAGKTKITKIHCHSVLWVVTSKQAQAFVFESEGGQMTSWLHIYKVKNYNL